MNFDFVGLGLQERVRNVALDSGVKPGSYLDDLCPHMSVLILSSKSDSTNRTYFNALKRWENFIKLQGHSALPANPIHVALYLTHLLENGATQHPVNSAVYAITVLVYQTRPKILMFHLYRKQRGEKRQNLLSERIQ